MIRPQNTFCERARADVSLLLDGELSQLERAFLDAHLERCAACRAYYADVVAVTADLRAAPLAEPAVGVTPPRRVRPLAFRRVPVSVAAALVIGAAGLTGLAAFPRANTVSVPHVSGAGVVSPDVEVSILRRGSNVTAHTRATRAL